jgi:IS1 family transposase
MYPRFRWTRCGASWEKKDKSLTEEERASGELGSQWDHVAVDPETKLMVSLVQGSSRDQATCDKLVEDFAERTGGVPPELVTTDEHAQYKNSILKKYGVEYRPRRRSRRGRKRSTRRRGPPGMVYATVKKTRKNGRVVHVRREIVLGTEEDLVAALEASSCSKTINTSFVERNNGTSRHFNSRKQRDTYSFSKQLAEHEAMSWLTVAHYNFCWTNRTLRVPLGEQRYTKRSPAMAAGLADHVWTVEELLTRQALSSREALTEGGGEPAVAGRASGVRRGA